MRVSDTPAIVGITGSGAITRDPFDRRGWSSSSYFFFTELQKQNALVRAFGVEVPRIPRYLYMMKNFHPVREVWRNHFYMDPAYRHALTKLVSSRLSETDLDNNLLQLGAMFDTPSIVKDSTRCFSYNDGNAAELLRSPYAPKNLSARRIDQVLAYEKHVAQGMTKIFTMSEYLRNSFIRDFEMAPEKVHAIGSGINLNDIPPEALDKEYDTQEILFIGVEFSRKGGWELLEAFRGIHQRLPKTRLHIVGPKSLEIPVHLKEGVIYHGFLNKQDPVHRATLETLFKNCCLFAMPSLYEPFGIAPLEAMTYSIPCIVTNQWALPEITLGGKVGELVECGSADDLEAKIIALFQNPDRLKHMGIAARAHVLNYYTWDKVVERLLKHL